MRGADLRDIIGGLLVMAIGGAFAWTASRYPTGAGPTLGPGYVPMAAGIIAMLLGAAILLSGFFRSAEMTAVPPRPVLAVLAAIVAFMFLVPRVGLVPTLFAVTVIAALGSQKSRPLPVVLLAIFVAVACWVVFIEGLGLPFRAWRNPL